MVIKISNSEFALSYATFTNADCKMYSTSEIVKIYLN